MRLSLFDKSIAYRERNQFDHDFGQIGRVRTEPGPQGCQARRSARAQGLGQEPGEFGLACAFVGRGQKFDGGAAGLSLAMNFQQVVEHQR